MCNLCTRTQSICNQKKILMSFYKWLLRTSKAVESNLWWRSLRFFGAWKKVLPLAIFHRRGWEDISEVQLIKLKKNLFSPFNIVGKRGFIIDRFYNKVYNRYTCLSKLVFLYDVEKLEPNLSLTKIHLCKKIMLYVLGNFAKKYYWK